MNDNRVKAVIWQMKNKAMSGIWGYINSKVVSEVWYSTRTKTA